MTTLSYTLGALLASLALAGCVEPRPANVRTAEPLAVALPPQAEVLPRPTLEARQVPSILPVVPEAPPPLPLLPPEPPKPRSAQLPSGFYNPMPGGVFAGYQGDTGLDIAGSPRPIYALAAGTLDYSEPGHTLWTGRSDTANSVRFELDTPIPYKGRRVTHVYYTHLSRLETLQHEGDPVRRHVEGGELLGMSGVARGSPHLHVGLLLDGEVEQYWGTFLLADEIRKVLGGFKNGDRLPPGPGDEPAPRATPRRPGVASRRPVTG